MECSLLRTRTKLVTPSKNDCIEWHQSHLYILQILSSHSSAAARRHFGQSEAITALVTIVLWENVSSVEAHLGKCQHRYRQ